MTPPSTPKDKFLVNVVNPYLAEVKMHPQTLQFKDGVLHKQDLEEPKKEGDKKTRLEELEHEMFKYKKMVERGVEVNHRIISDLTDDHHKENASLGDSQSCAERNFAPASTDL